ncbi:MAG: biphenyl-2,3-diol 1,2-dioxygenase, partial [Burkholderiaceae bacterium]|nr:biphenyl-2,3-diol 1,2-dioxygenase [Burkholderiaceae bacterium]
MKHPSKGVLHAPHAYPENALPPGVLPLARPAPLVKAQSLAFLMFEKPDLAACEAFLTDFGLRTVEWSEERLLMRGSGPAPCIYMARRGARARCLGSAFSVAG